MWKLKLICFGSQHRTNPGYRQHKIVFNINISILLCLALSKKIRGIHWQFGSSASIWASQFKQHFMFQVETMTKMPMVTLYVKIAICAKRKKNNSWTKLHCFHWFNIWPRIKPKNQILISMYWPASLFELHSDLIPYFQILSNTPKSFYRTSIIRFFCMSTL